MTSSMKPRCITYHDLWEMGLSHTSSDHKTVVLADPQDMTSHQTFLLNCAGLLYPTIHHPHQLIAPNATLAVAPYKVPLLGLLKLGPSDQVMTTPMTFRKKSVKNQLYFKTQDPSFFNRHVNYLVVINGRLMTDHDEGYVLGPDTYTLNDRLAGFFYKKPQGPTFAIGFYQASLERSISSLTYTGVPGQYLCRQDTPFFIMGEDACLYPYWLDQRLGEQHISVPIHITQNRQLFAVSIEY